MNSAKAFYGPPQRLFVVTVDVEADDAWRRPESLQLRSLEAIPAFQKLCTEHCVIPTYLNSYEVLKDQKYVSFIRDRLLEGACEAGIHPHVWTIPPFINEENGIDIPVLRHYQSQLEKDLLFAKLDRLHETAERAFQIRPKAHRAGRWGLCSRTVNWLAGREYDVDTSIVPLKSFKDPAISRDLSPDFMRAPRNPYRMSANDIMKPGKLDLVEVPVTTATRMAIRSVIRLVDHWKLKHGGTRVKRFLTKRYLYPLEFRPYPHYPPGTLPRLADLALSKGQGVLNLMLHSSELTLGTSPYTDTKQLTSAVWEHLDEIFAFVKHRPIAPLSICEAASLLKANNRCKL